MSRKLSPASESISSIRLSDDSAVTICSSRTPFRKRLQFLPNSKRFPRMTSSALQDVSPLLRASSIFLLQGLSYGDRGTERRRDRETERRRDRGTEGQRDLWRK